MKLSMQIPDLGRLKEHIEEYKPTIYYRRDDLQFAVLAGKLSWKGKFASAHKADDFEKYLKQAKGTPIVGWTDPAQLFGDST